MDGSIKLSAVTKLICVTLVVGVGRVSCSLLLRSGFGGAWKTRLPGVQRLQAEGRDGSLGFLGCHRTVMPGELIST